MPLANATRSVTATPVQQTRGMLVALALAAALVLLQAFIGGRVLLFAFPGLAVLALAALGGVVPNSLSRRQASVPCLVATGLFGGYVLLRAALTPGYFARADLYAVIGALVVYGITATIITSSRARLVVVLSLLALAVLDVLIGAIQFTRGDNFMLIPFLQRADYGQRASGFFVCPNHLAGFLEVVAIFGVALTCWSRWPVWTKLLVGYATGIFYLGLALTGSRGGYISALASFVTFAALSLVLIRAASPRRWLRFAAAGAVVLGLAIIAGAYLVHENAFLNSRAANIIDRNNIRMTLWRAAVTQWKLQPIVGTGAGTYRFYGRQFRTEEMQNDPVDVHNDYLHLLCEYGLVGAAAFVLFLAAHVHAAWRTLRALVKSLSTRGGAILSNRVALSVAAWSAVAAYVVHSAVDFNLHIPANAMLLAFVFGIVANPSFGRSATAETARMPVIPRFAIAALAMILLIQCVRLCPGEYYTERARTALRDEDPVRSLAFTDKALQYEQRNPEIYFYRGRALIASAHQCNVPERRLGYYLDAVASFTAASRLAPLDGSYALELAFTYDEIGRFDDAERMYAEARSRDPRSFAVAQLYQTHVEERQKADAAREGGSNVNPGG